ncbi:bleomycin resistance protein [Candidatus Woesearchaeota archaeon CG10_big_fil_rev_8_21_14_0_10_37_12]|nr:MAG: bleomycin resistance protein [Candidatus Woesearchaeota archaeon CG10_big_fil_rev_8_21_14_0_10_37_12]
MKATIGHIGINLSSKKSFQFWKDLLNYLEFKITEDGMHFDANDGKSYLCVNVTSKKYNKEGFHRKRTGLNHLAFNVSSPKFVDQFVSEFLKPRKIQPLYGGPNEYPDYAKEYYSVYFEDYDRIKIEIVYELT